MTADSPRADIPDGAARAQALDPNDSFIVQAPAGSGKTTLLAQRYMHLLCRVRRPEEILAITFTKKAAAEMRHRVLALLREDTAEAAVIRKRDAAENWQLFSNPNVVKIQTIDSFALEIASQTPFVESAAGLRITEDATSYYETAASALLGRLYTDDPTNVLVADFLAFLDNDAGRAVRLLSHMLARRDQWLEPAAAVAVRNSTDLTAALLSEAIDALQADIRAQLDACFTANDADMLRTLADTLGLADDWHTLFPVLLTKTAALRKRLTVKEGIHDPALKRELNAWLQSLHERGLESLIASHTHIPATPESGSQQLTLLHLCCVCLSLAAQELDQRLSDAGVLDFTGLLLRAKMALRDDQGPTDLALYLDYRIRHILVDEYQDTSQAQYGFFNLLTEGWDAAGDNTFFAVGDPMQSIYRFRDADVSIFAASRKHGLANVPLTACTLRANFRSDPTVVDWCNDLFAVLFGPSNAIALGEVSFSAATPMVARRPAAAVNCLRFADAQSETQAVVQHVQSLLAADANAEIAVLCRARPHLTQLLDTFANTGIAVQATDMDLLANRPVIRDLMALHSIVLQPTERLGWFSVLRSPLFGLSLPELTDLAASADLETALEDSQHSLADHLPQLKRLYEALAWARPRLYEVPLRELIEGLWLRCGGANAYSDAEWQDANAWFDLLESLHGDAYEHATVERAMRSLFAASSGQARVQVMTIHKAKGLEFDHVIVPYLDRRAQNDEPQLLLWRAGAQGLFMGVRGDPVHDWLVYEETERARNEEKRLLYVACTRAKLSLWTSFACPLERNPGGLAKWLVQIADDATSPGAQVRATEDYGNQGDLFKIQHLQRLPSAYAWREPAYTPVAAAANVQPVMQPDRISARYEVALGLLVHRALAWYAGGQTTPPADIVLRLERWATELNVEDDEHPRLVAACIDHLSSTLADQHGRWLLEAHDDAQSEWPLTGVIDDVVVRVVLDRTFIHDGVRWIVDFKTSEPQPGESQGAFFDREVTRYAPQLNRYRTIAGSIYGQPIKTALYFTAESELVPVD